MQNQLGICAAPLSGKLWKLAFCPAVTISHFLLGELRQFCLGENQIERAELDMNTNLGLKSNTPGDIHHQEMSRSYLRGAEYRGRQFN